MAAPRANFGYLLAGLLVLLLAGPAVFQLFPATGSVIFQAAFTTTLLLGVWSLQARRHWFVIGVALALVSLAITLADTFLGREFVIETGLITVDLLVLLAFSTVSLVFAVQHVTHDSEINFNRMMGAICVYLLLGVALAVVNLLLLFYQPGSFDGIGNVPGSRVGLDMIYYTFVTMTTLGYGDIRPVGALARALAYMTAVTGQFYIALLVGSLVGLYLQRQK